MNKETNKWIEQKLEKFYQIFVEKETGKVNELFTHVDLKHFICQALQEAVVKGWNYEKNN